MGDEREDMKYLLTDDEDRPIALCEGVSGVQQHIEECIINSSPNATAEELSCLEDFRVYEVGQRSSVTISLNAIPDKI